jgi:uncharacterized protein GlcG (DUF336 family)
MIEKFSLDITEADRALAACRKTAAERGVAVSIAVVDDAGQLVAFARMDGARGFTADLATRKARVAASIGLPSRVPTEMARANPGAVSEAAVGAGGMAVRHGTITIGAIGVSGALPDIDDAIAAAGVETFR